MERSVTVIPAKSRNEIIGSKDSAIKTRVAAYCRVSTDQEDQLHSFEAQVSYYTSYIKSHSQYELAGIYADEGISGTNTRKREQFRKMIRDCEEGKIDLVITKSISRFARNTQDCLEYSRKLKNLGIGIIFEKENINTMDSTGELLFTILSSLAQDESRNISENCKWGIRTNFKNGKVTICPSGFLGYDTDADGHIVINEKEAAVVRRIYREFLGGMNPQQIAKGLEDDGVEGCGGKTKWYTSTVVGILKNEKHMGDALLQKTYTADYLTKRQVRNKGEVTQYYVQDSHQGIIDRESWNAVQEEFVRRERFKAEHGIATYSYGTGYNPFTNRIFCGKCGLPYTHHCWKKRGIFQWQCKERTVRGERRCMNDTVNQQDLEKGFIKCFNGIIRKRDKGMERWKAMEEHGTALEKLRARQMMEITAQPELTDFVPELAQLVILETTVLGARTYEFTFMDGQKRRISV
jgi:DNA invertase Pin-like site-specific DNA recombinase